MHQSLIDFLINPLKLKVGVNIRLDGLKLARDFDVYVEGMIELSEKARAVVPPIVFARTSGVISLATLVEQFVRPS